MSKLTGKNSILKQPKNLVPNAPSMPGSNVVNASTLLKQPEALTPNAPIVPTSNVVGRRTNLKQPEPFTTNIQTPLVNSPTQLKNNLELQGATPTGIKNSAFVQGRTQTPSYLKQLATFTKYSPYPIAPATVGGSYNPVVPPVPPVSYAEYTKAFSLDFTS
jgi:hypothetical protein